MFVLLSRIAWCDVSMMLEAIEVLLNAGCWHGRKIWRLYSTQVEVRYCHMFSDSFG